MATTVAFRTDHQTVAVSRRNPLNLAARLVSDVFAPPFILLATMFLLGSRVTSGEFWLPALIYASLAVFVPGAALVWMHKSGRVSDIHMNERKERILPFLWCIFGAFLGSVALNCIDCPATVQRLANSHCASLPILLLVTLYWKVSIHAAAAAGAAVIVSTELGASPFLGASFLLVVAWSRLQLRRHSLAQLVVGSLVGALCFLAF